MNEVVDFLEAESAISKRLEAACDGLHNVSSTTDLESIQSSSRTESTAYVIYDGYRVLEQHVNGLRPRIEQAWVVIVAAHSTATRTHVRTVGRGSLAMSVINALLGWKPSSLHSALALADAPCRPFHDNGMAHLPFAFTTRIVTKGGL